MEAVILAGGQGTRLLPYTTDLPKALVPVGGKPVIEILLSRLKLGGVTKVHLAVNHLSEKIMTALGDGSRLGLTISYSHESEPLSTVGPLTLIPSLPETFLVANADILTDLDIKSLVKSHHESGCKLTVATFKRTDQMEYGVLQTGHGNRVTGFTEKPSYDFLVSMGIYVFSRSVLKYVPAKTRFGFDDLMKTLLTQKEPINTLLHDGFWLDIGRAEDYLRANAQDADAVKRLFEG
jgi:NDP-sugar pyrophosphorylase family protein